jgi:hypothetical protein
MKKLTVTGLLIGMFLLVAFAFTNTPFAAQISGVDIGVKQWKIMTYLPKNDYDVPYALPVKPIRNGGIAFDFWSTPDRAVLIAELPPSNKKSNPSDFTGKTIQAIVAIEATDAATFNYYYTGGTRPANVRLYFQRVNGSGDTGVECPSGWHPERPDCEAQYWWSNPESIDLQVLAGMGADGDKLEALLDPTLWSDRDGHMANSDSNHVRWFADAVAHVSKVGLSFGGGNNFAFGCGVDEPSTAVFNLYNFSVK